MAIKVSVIVPAYRSGTGIDRVIASLDAQTLPAHEFEVIIVDDGSPDDTFAHLEAIAITHSNVKVTRIENSGWPSRPRNVAVDIAQGEYLLFMDHDDYLYPNGLARSYEYAKENGADILSPKESKTSDVGWMVGETKQNLPNGKATKGISSLMPMVPHKFYRRDFINRYGIRFPEGPRMLWEDIYFNVQSYRHAAVVSVLADTPIYKWVQTGANNSSTYGPESEEFWEKLIRLLDFIVATLPGEEFAADRELLLLHQFRKRVLGRIANQLRSGIHRELEMSLDNAKRILAEYVPEKFDRRLGKILQPRAFLLRAEAIDLLRELLDAEAGLTGSTMCTDIGWEDGVLVIATTTTWHVTGGAPFHLVDDEGGVVRDVSDELRSIIPEDMLDVTKDVGKASSDILVRSRTGHITWALPTTSEVRLRPDGNSTVAVTVHSRATLDIDHAVFGEQLAGTLWDFHARNSLLGLLNHHAVQAGEALTRVALINGRSAILYKNRDRKLSMDLKQRVRNIIEDASPAVDRATVTRGAGRHVWFSLPLDDVFVVGTAELDCEVGRHRFGGPLRRILLNRRVSRLPGIKRVLAYDMDLRPARLIADENGARIDGVLPVARAAYAVVCRFEGRTATTGLRATVPARGAVSFSLV